MAWPKTDLRYLAYLHLRSIQNAYNNKKKCSPSLSTKKFSNIR